MVNRNSALFAVLPFYQLERQQIQPPVHVPSNLEHSYLINDVKPEGLISESWRRIPTISVPSTSKRCASKEGTNQRTNELIKKASTELNQLKK